MAQCYVGLCYENGCGITKNEKLAFKYYERVGKSFAIEQLNIGFYGNQIGVERNLKLAIDWYKNIIGIDNPGHYYKYEKDIEKNYEVF